MNLSFLLFFILLFIFIYFFQFLQPVDDNIMHWRGWLKGPPATPYEGGRFYVDIKIPADYPFSPPVMKFATRIWHPNVSSQTGFICLDILYKEWSPALTIRTALLSLQVLLNAPNVDDPQDGVVAGQLRSNPELFKQTAKEWTRQYAMEGPPQPPPFQYPDQLKTLIEMGISESEAKAALLQTKGNVEDAVNKLYS